MRFFAGVKVQYIISLEWNLVGSEVSLIVTSPYASTQTFFSARVSWLKLGALIWFFRNGKAIDENHHILHKLHIDKLSHHDFHLTQRRWSQSPSATITLGTAAKDATGVKGQSSTIEVL